MNDQLSATHTGFIEIRQFYKIPHKPGFVALWVKARCNACPYIISFDRPNELTTFLAERKDLCCSSSGLR